MFAFYAIFSTLNNAVTLSMLCALLKKTSLLASAPVIGVTIKSEDYRALPMLLSCFFFQSKYFIFRFSFPPSFPDDLMEIETFSA
jgi:hypothetical protein